MPRGPLPKPAGQRRRANAPTIPTTNLPAGGRKGPIPRPPSWVTLGKQGMAWWRWAWRTPQSAAWSTGDVVALARRAQLEDDLAAQERHGTLDLDSLLQLEEGDDAYVAVQSVEAVVRSLARLATGKLAVIKECRELDDRFGLTAKGLAALRWQIVADKPTEAELKEQEAAGPPAQVRRLRAVDPAAG